FLLASYRKQRKWIVLRQLLLLLARLAVAALLIAMLCGWTGGRQLLGALGGQTTHHVYVLDDSYSMSDESGGTAAYDRALQSLEDLTKRLADDDGEHQLTVLRSSRANLTVRAGSTTGDAAADLASQTITPDARLIGRVMATEASSIQTDMADALDLASELLVQSDADSSLLYVASDFRQRDWSTSSRTSEALRAIGSNKTELKLIDCAQTPSPNLALTDLSPQPDVWVAGVPVVVRATVKNYGQTVAKNVTIDCRVVRYGAESTADPTSRFSGQVESLPTLVIESIEPGSEVTKSFQVYVAVAGTHAITATLGEDSLSIDNQRSCTLPLSDAERVLIVDSDPDGRGAYHIASVLNPGSQVQVGAIPEIATPSALRSLTLESLSRYRAVYLVDVPEIGQNAATALHAYVRQGGGLAVFLGQQVQAGSYNQNVFGGKRYLIPLPLGSIKTQTLGDEKTNDVQLGDATSLMRPLQSVGDAALALVGLSQSWTFNADGAMELDQESAESNGSTDSEPPRYSVPLKRRDGLPLVTEHRVGRGRVITSLSSLSPDWTNWSGDPSFVVFLLQANASLWSAAAPPTQRLVDGPLVRELPVQDYTPEIAFLPPVNEPPRVPVELGSAVRAAADADTDPEGDANDPSAMLIERGVLIQPQDQAVSGADNLVDFLRPGVGEWQLTRVDGQSQVVPVAANVRIGEGELGRVQRKEVLAMLAPADVQFVSSGAWSDQNQTAGSSFLSLVLLGMLAVVLSTEQALAYWASYHSSPSNKVAQGVVK
ncbi:MAG: VWA domain-containing protein, partial [Planctomycetota bacterium]